MMTTQLTPPPAPTSSAVVVLHWLRFAVGTVVGMMTLLWAHQLAFRSDNPWVTFAFLFVGLVFVIVVLTGMAPSKFKFGDIEVDWQQARESGVAEGLEAGTKLSKHVAAGHVPVDQIQAALHVSLTSPESLRVDGINLPIAQLAPPAAKAKIEAIVDALTTVAKLSGGTS